MKVIKNQGMIDTFSLVDLNNFSGLFVVVWELVVLAAFPRLLKVNKNYFKAS